MSAVCIIDTSVFVEILNVPVKSTRHASITAELGSKIKNDEMLFLPMATIFETGNHIAQNGTGVQRRQCAARYVEQVRDALDGRSPFKPIQFVTQLQMQEWLEHFPDSAMRESGIGDLSIIHDFHRVCVQNEGRRIYIWSLDGHLSSYSREALI